MIQVQRTGTESGRNKQNAGRFHREAQLEFLHGLGEHDVRVLRLLRPQTADHVPLWSGSSLRVVQRRQTGLAAQGAVRTPVQRPKGRGNNTGCGPFSLLYMSDTIQ